MCDCCNQGYVISAKAARSSAKPETVLTQTETNRAVMITAASAARRRHRSMCIGNGGGAVCGIADGRVA